MGKLFTIDVYFKGKIVQNWDDAFFKRKMCKIGRLMLNLLFLNVETLNVKPFKKAQSICVCLEIRKKKISFLFF